MHRQALALERHDVERLRIVDQGQLPLRRQPVLQEETMAATA
jgi:hypothetical protein